MILRVMRGRGTGEQIAALRTALDAAFKPTAAERDGLERFHLGWRPASGGSGDEGAPATDREVAVVSHWLSAEAAARGDAAGTSPLTTVRRVLRDVTIAHYEIDETIGRHSDDQAVALRIATGTFSRPGADAEMQNLLRQRAPLIGDDMAEAWVGRRLTGRAVEVTFVSAWRRLPSDRSLDEAFWPDIALRYDEFVVEVYATVE